MSYVKKVNFVDLKHAIAQCTIILCDDKGKLSDAGMALDKKHDNIISGAIAASQFNGKTGQSLEVWANGKNSTLFIILGVAMDARSDAQNHWRDVGGYAASTCKYKLECQIIAQAPGKIKLSSEDIASLALGFLLSSYRFNRYKSKKQSGENEAFTPRALSVACDHPNEAASVFEVKRALGRGVVLARNLSNQPANVLTTTAFVKEIEHLKKRGIEVEILDEKQLTKLGMRALLGVGQGSESPSYVGIMKWFGAKDKAAKPIALVGKGVVFDTGGISIKPSAGMEDMKGDMGGAAAVTGAMKAIAMRKAKANVVGFVGLVENMPDGKAQRPGDVVQAMSGTTIEVNNTDAEGRLVLADVLWYAKEHYKPSAMIDLATLTGAIIIALGKTYAGLFSNNDQIVQKLKKASEMCGEKLWHMPLDAAFDKQIISKVADIKNSAGREGGSCTAAAFLSNFVGDIPWAHIDIAGTAMGPASSAINSSWGSGYGVMLLDSFVSLHEEQD